MPLKNLQKNLKLIRQIFEKEPEIKGGFFINFSNLFSSINPPIKLSANSKTIIQVGA